MQNLWECDKCLGSIEHHRWRSNHSVPRVTTICLKCKNRIERREAHWMWTYGIIQSRIKQIVIGFIFGCICGMMFFTYLNSLNIKK